MRGRQRDGDTPAVGVADHVDALHAEPVEQRDRPLCVLIDTPRRGWRTGCAETGQVGRNHPERRQPLRDRLHQLLARAPAVEQQHGRTAARLEHGRERILDDAGALAHGAG
jgi:hypothetical protein